MSIHVNLWNTNQTFYTTILTVLFTLLTDFQLINISQKLVPGTFRIKELVQFKMILTQNRKNNGISLHFLDFLHL